MSLFEINNLNAFMVKCRSCMTCPCVLKRMKLLQLSVQTAQGKALFIRTISGLIEECTGEIKFSGDRIDGLQPHEIVEKGIVQIPEGRKLFPFFTVLENLEIGAHNARAAKNIKETIEEVLELFPKLKQLTSQLARTLSGGEQQMLAIARGLMAKPKLLMFDEPSLGLAPFLVKNVFEIILKVREQGIPILLVEQNVKQSLRLSDHGYVLENGKIVMHGTR